MRGSLIYVCIFFFCWELCIYHFSFWKKYWVWVLFVLITALIISLSLVSITTTNFFFLNHKYISIIQSSKITIRIKQHAESQWNNGNFLKKSSKEKLSIIPYHYRWSLLFLEMLADGLSLGGFVLFKCGLAWSILRLGLVSIVLGLGFCRVFNYEKTGLALIKRGLLYDI